MTYLTPSVLFVLVACRATVDSSTARATLGDAATQVSVSDFAGGARTCEKLVRELPDDSRDADLQRFFAAEVATRAHLSAAFEGPFLREAASAPGAGFRIDGANGAQPLSHIPHLVATMWWSSYGRQWYEPVRGLDLAASPTEALPGQLVALGVRNAAGFLNLAALTAYARLAFQDRIDQVLDGMPELESLDTCELALAGAEMPRAARPWVYLGVFQRLSRSDEPEAYRFAIRALESAPGMPGAPTRAQTDAVVKWIEHDSRYVFKCPNCKTPVDPRLTACSVCRRPNLDFEPELRAR